MKTTITLVMAALVVTESVAQIAPTKREIRSITDVNMVIESGWTKIEIFPTQRVGVATNQSGIRVMTEKSSLAAARLSAQEPVLIFNHTYQQFGYATGEIAFRFKDSTQLSTVKGIVPGAEAVGAQFYVVNVETPAAILSVTAKLRARSDIDWVVPTINYLPLSSRSRE